jgi:hypothetical protein
MQSQTIVIPSLLRARFTSQYFAPIVTHKKGPLTHERKEKKKKKKKKEKKKRGPSL